MPIGLAAFARLTGVRNTQTRTQTTANPLPKSWGLIYKISDDNLTINLR